MSQHSLNTRNHPHQWEQAGCSGKEGFDSYRLAQQVIRRRPRRGKRGAWRARQIYKCDYCRKWHIGRSLGPQSLD